MYKMTEKLILIALMHENTPHFLFFFFETFGAFSPAPPMMLHLNVSELYLQVFDETSDCSGND